MDMLLLKRKISKYCTSQVEEFYKCLIYKPQLGLQHSYYLGTTGEGQPLGSTPRPADLQWSEASAGSAAVGLKSTQCAFSPQSETDTTDSSGSLLPAVIIYTRLRALPAQEGWSAGQHTLVWLQGLLDVF